MWKLSPVTAAAIGTLLLAGLLAACNASTAVAPSQVKSPAIIAYAARLNIDMDVLDVQVYKKLECKTRATCRDELQTIRTMTLTVLRDAYDEPPARLAGLAAEVTLAGRRFLGQIDTAISVVLQADGDYVAASAVPDIHDLDMAAGGVICWPKKPAAVEGGESPSGYNCL